MDGLHKNFASKINDWKRYYDLSSPEQAKFPAPYDQTEEMIGLILLNCIRSDKIVPAIRVSINTLRNLVKLIKIFDL